MDSQKVVAILERFLDPQETRAVAASPEKTLGGAVERLQRTLEATRGRLAAQDEKLALLRADLARVKGGYAEVAQRFEDLAQRAVVPVQPVLKPASPRLRSISVPPPLPAVAPLVRERFVVALAFVLVTVAAAALREARPLRAQTGTALRAPAARASDSMTPPRGDNAVAEGLRLVFAYRPTAAKVTVGQVMETMLGKALDPSHWELTPITRSTFWIVFKPYTDDVGLERQYRFRVDAAAGRVRPTAETLALLRADVAGRLASRSDFQGLRQALDLRGDDEVVVGQPSDRVGL